MKTYSARLADLKKDWVVIDAEGVVLGRLASLVALRLKGKHRAMYTPSADCGDRVVVINAEKVRLTGAKRKKKVYYKHTGYPGGIKETTPEKILSGAHPERVIEKAVQRMLSRDALGRQQFSNLRVYAGTEHPHEPQKPKAVDIAGMNPKNARARKN
jgi:large subunit ribosomal protein L13